MADTLVDNGWEHFEDQYLRAEMNIVAKQLNFPLITSYQWDRVNEYCGPDLPGHKAVFQYLADKSISIPDFQMAVSFPQESIYFQIPPRIPKSKDGITKDINALNHRLTGDLAEFIPAVRAIMCSLL